MWFDILLFSVGIAAGSIASIAGFGVGSFLTPIVALKVGFEPAIVAVSIAHAAGSLLRLWLLRFSVNKKILLRFGLLSAIGGGVGALLHVLINSSILGIVFGSLMILAGLTYAFRVSSRIKLTGPAAWVVGLISGIFGGLVGNQGGLRAAALTSFRLKKMEFVATATATALMVDAFRIPIYLISNGQEFALLWGDIVWMVLGVLVGTVIGAPILRKISDRYFMIIVSTILVIVGLLVIMQL